MINKKYYHFNKRKNIKIAQILYSGLGGHGSVAFSLLDSLKEKNFSFLLGFLGIEPLLDAYKERCKKQKIKGKYFKAIAGFPFYSWPKITLWLYKERPNIIILHSVSAVIPIIIYTKITKTPLIFVEHQANSLKKKSAWKISKIGMKFADKIIYLTEAYKQEMQKTLSESFVAEKIFVIPNGIDTQRFTPSKNSILENKKIKIGMAARFTSMRCQDLLVECIKQLKEDYPDFDWHLTLAGDGETFKDIAKLIQDKNLQDNITLTGNLNEQELITWFQKLDIYVHATKGETLSTSMLQAMACGLPLVASEVPGVTNLISNSENFGILVHEQTASAFSKKIGELANNKEKAKKMAKTARNIAIENYSIESMTSKYLELIKDFFTLNKI